MSSPLRPLAALVAKDLKVFFTDGYSVLLAFVAPIALASFMAAIFGGAGPQAPSKISIRLVDQDGGPVSASILSKAAADPRLDAQAVDLAEAESAVRRGVASVAVVIPPGFGPAAADALYGDAPPPELRVLHDPTRPSEVNLVRGLLTRIILEAVGHEAFGPGPADRLLAEFSDDEEDAGMNTPADPPRDADLQRAEFLALFPDDDTATDADLAHAFPGLADLLEEDDADLPPLPSAPPQDKPSAGLTMPYATRDESIAAGGPEGERAALAGHAFAGMVVQFILFSAVEWGVGLLGERQRGLWKRLRAAPVSRVTLMAGKAASCAILSLMITAVVFAAGMLVFGFRVQGSLAGFALVAVSSALTAAGFGLLVASLGRTPSGARSVSVLAVLAMVMLGGGWIPSFLFPDWLQAVTPVVPTRWAVDAYDGVLSRGFTLAETLPAVGVLTGFALAFGLLALGTFRWSEG